ncbi:hydrogenase expression/formation protein HypE [Carboxydochorda subterranea]|uniref:Hydrogenase expression/formation protein HypE n=1 Tax=Carboxydichorda subterranea TaxID=3109565 RepID=A0ABZ1BVG3_9FIRM|nr:hydrogenase expression/formation protein HypE [Limnochorda sp. L945t]WRP16516.1 hydrogenase expression/formation protein HypE [Limnochorda sp. L945t]
MHGRDPGYILVAHGSGGKLTGDLFRDLFLPAFRNPYLEQAGDQAVVPLDGVRLAVTTDSFVVSPLFFPGGDIGRLAVYGTVNDLAVGGAVPAYLTAGFIIEEGLSTEDLRRVVQSMSEAAARAGVSIIAGDTKVVERGKGDGLFINTTGVGWVPPGVELGPARIRPGDRLLVSGPVGDHGAAVMARRAGLDFEVEGLVSDTAPLAGLVQALLAAFPGAVRCMRDATRGGLATVLVELATASGKAFRVDEAAIAVREPVRGLCEVLGIDPLYAACEGRMVAVVAADVAEAAVELLRTYPDGQQAMLIGTVAEGPPGEVLMRTVAGGSRRLELLEGEQLPRIC